MAMYNVYSHPEFRRYRASICSKATLFMIFIYAFTFIVPILIIYRSNGLWITTWTTNEQPDVSFKHQIISLVDIEDTQSQSVSYLAWSTYPQFNVIHQANLRVPLIKSRELDENRDGKNDVLLIDIEIPVRATEAVHRFCTLLFFEYKLKQLALVTFEGMAVISGESNLPAAGFSTIGDLRLKQRNPLPHKGIDNTYNTPIVAQGSISPNDYDLAYLFQQYSSRNLTVHYMSEYPLWMSGSPSQGRFKVSVRMRYPEERVLYHTGFWQMFKYAVVQYIAILVVFAFLCERVKRFVFSHQIVNTVAIKPFKSS